MQVILVKSVRKLGKVGEVVNVKDGYGRNYLVPQELAIRATKDNIEFFSHKKKELEAKNNEAKEEAEKLAKSIDGKSLTFILQSAADGRLFGSVSAKLLAEQVSEMVKHKLNYTNILLESPIKFNGVYDIKVILHPEVQAKILIVIAKSESEANDALRDFKEGKITAAKEAAEELAAEAEYAKEVAVAAKSEESSEE